MPSFCFDRGQIAYNRQISYFLMIGVFVELQSQLLSY